MSWASRGCLNHYLHKTKFDYVERYQKSCYSASCKVCYKKWLAREASRATERLERGEKKLEKPPKHIVLSPPSWLHHNNLKDLKKVGYRIMKTAKADGGVMVFHAYRKNHETRTWYFSPHFHIVGFGWIDGVAEIFKKDGWVIKNKGTRDSVFQTVYYLLSHCTIVKDRHSVTWFGEVSYSKLKIQKEDENGKKCPDCNCELVDLQPLEPFRPPDKEFAGFVEPGLYYHPTGRSHDGN
jgi:hypothetical protein